jgi:hypothetical protein
MMIDPRIDFESRDGLGHRALFNLERTEQARRWEIIQAKSPGALVPGGIFGGASSS